MTESEESIFSVLLRGLFQMILVSLVVNYIGSFIKNQYFTPTNLNNQDSDVFKNYYMSFYLAEKNFDGEWLNSVNQISSINNWTLNKFNDGPYNNSTFFNTTIIQVNKNLLEKGSIHLIACLSDNGDFKNVNDFLDDLYGHHCVTSSLTTLRKYTQIEKKNLIFQESSNSRLVEGQFYNFWNNDIIVNVVFEVYSAKQNVNSELHSNIMQPIVHINKFWNLKKDHKVIEPDINFTLTLNLMYYPITDLMYGFYKSQELSQNVGFSNEELDHGNDLLKETFLNTNKYLLLISFIVSILHTIFDFLAFKNDITFWSSRQTHEGLSLRSVIFSCFSQLIVLLYVIDNDTNFMIKFTCFLGLMVDVWKLKKILKLVKRSFVLPFYPNCNLTLYVPIYRVESHEKSPTDEYDKLAFKYLGVITIPLFFGYCIYSLVYHKYKGWYSYLLNVAYGYLLVFGFIMMTPQLFINYKLKSVAHMPWKMMTYKFINTFIDDMFAFIIKTPMLYRIGCFRDDIIFFIFLYQKYVYPTDMKRVNEFGTKGEEYTTITNKCDKLPIKLD